MKISVEDLEIVNGNWKFQKYCIELQENVFSGFSQRRESTQNDKGNWKFDWRFR